MVSDMKREFEITKGYKVDRKALKRVVGSLRREYMLTDKTEDITNEIADLYDEAKKTGDYDELEGQIERVAERLINSGERMRMKTEE